MHYSKTKDYQRYQIGGVKLHRGSLEQERLDLQDIYKIWTRGSGGDIGDAHLKRAILKFLRNQGRRINSEVSVDQGRGSQMVKDYIGQILPKLRTFITNKSTRRLARLRQQQSHDNIPVIQSDSRRDVINALDTRFPLPRDSEWKMSPGGIVTIKNNPFPARYHGHIYSPIELGGGGIAVGFHFSLDFTQTVDGRTTPWSIRLRSRPPKEQSYVLGPSRNELHLGYFTPGLSLNKLVTKIGKTIGVTLSPRGRRDLSDDFNIMVIIYEIIVNTLQKYNLSTGGGYRDNTEPIYLSLFQLSN